MFHISLSRYEMIFSHETNEPQLPLSCEEADCGEVEQFVVWGSNVTSVTLEVKEMCETSHTAAALGGIEVIGAYVKRGKHIVVVSHM